LLLAFAAALSRFVFRILFSFNFRQLHKVFPKKRSNEVCVKCLGQKRERERVREKESERERVQFVTTSSIGLELAKIAGKANKLDSFSTKGPAKSSN